MKHISLILIILCNILLFSCQSLSDDLRFIKEIELPYTIEVENYEKFVNKSLEQKEIYDYKRFVNLLGKHDNIAKIYFLGKFEVAQQKYIIYQDVTPNKSAEFFPNIYLVKIGENIKEFCLTSNTEDSFVERITITKDTIVIQENYWDSVEKRRKNDITKKYNLDFRELENTNIKENESNILYFSRFIQLKSTTDSLILEKECDLNKDNIKDKILVFSPKKKNDEKRFLTISVLLFKRNGDFIEFSNNNIIDSYSTNSYAEGFRDIAIKNNFFTIEENPSSQPIQNKYTTFIYNKNDDAIYLHKLGFITIYPDNNKDVNVIYSTNDFGKINFEEYNPKNIKY